MTPEREEDGQGSTDTEVLNIVRFVGPDDALRALLADDAAAVANVACSDDVNMEGAPEAEEVWLRFFTRESPAEVWLEPIGRSHTGVTSTLIYQALDRGFAGRTVWQDGELSAYDWFDPALDYDMPSDLVDPMDLRAGAVNLDEEATYPESIEFVLQQVDEMAEAMPDGVNRALVWFYLDLSDPGDYEQLDEWTPYFGPMTDWAVVDLQGDALFEWVEGALHRAFKQAAENGPQREDGLELETTVLVHLYPSEAEGWFRATS